MSLAGGKVLAVHRLFAKASEVKDGASELTVWTFPALELETYTKFKAAVGSFKEDTPVAAKSFILFLVNMGFEIYQHYF